MQFTKPDYRLPEADRLWLQDYCHRELDGRKHSHEARRHRTALLDQHAMSATEHLLAPMRQAGRLKNAEQEIRRHNPGFDFVIDSWFRIQVKGRSWVEAIDFGAPALSKAAAWQSDLWVMVNFGSLLDGRHGAYFGDEKMAASSEIEWYIAPTTVVRAIAERYFGSKPRTRAKLWAGKVPRYQSIKHHYPELFQFRDAFHHIGGLLRQPPSTVECRL